MSCIPVQISKNDYDIKTSYTFFIFNIQIFCLNALADLLIHKIGVKNLKTNILVLKTQTMKTGLNILYACL